MKKTDAEIEAKKLKDKAYHKEYDRKNRDTINRHNRERYAKGPERAEYMKEYRELNREVTRTRDRERYKAKRLLEGKEYKARD